MIIFYCYDRLFIHRIRKFCYEKNNSKLLILNKVDNKFIKI